MLLENTIRMDTQSGKKKTKDTRNLSPDFSLLDSTDIKGTLPDCHEHFCISLLDAIPSPCKPVTDCGGTEALRACTGWHCSVYMRLSFQGVDGKIFSSASD